MSNTSEPVWRSKKSNFERAQNKKNSSLIPTLHHGVLPPAAAAAGADPEDTEVEQPAKKKHRPRGTLYQDLPPRPGRSRPNVKCQSSTMSVDDDTNDQRGNNSRQTTRKLLRLIFV